MNRGEHGRARAHDDCRLAARDARTLVTTLRVRQRRMKHRDALAEARAETAERLWRQRDLRHEHDRTPASRQRSRAGLQVDLSLPAPGRAVEQDVRALAAVQRANDSLDGCALRLAELLRLRLAGQGIALRRLRALPARTTPDRGDERERSCGRRAVVLGEPERELDECRR